jgi:multiple sugar transport system ATP-binding protein
VKLRLERKRSQALTSFTGETLLSGIRPQQIYFSRDREGRRHSDTEVEVTAKIIEPLGERIMVDAKLGEQDIVFLMISDNLPVPGEKIPIVIDGRNIHLFERESGERIVLGE